MLKMFHWFPVEALVLLACYCTILLIGISGNGWLLMSIGKFILITLFTSKDKILDSGASLRCFQQRSFESNPVVRNCQLRTSSANNPR